MTKVLTVVMVWASLLWPRAEAQTPGTVIAPWSEIAVDDLHFIRAVLRENHPGPADTLNPWFRDWYERGFNEAIALAGQAGTYPGYFFSIQYYMQGFQDGHLGALSEELLEDPRLRFQWPGFVVGYRSGQFRVVESKEQHVPLGATLISCDDRPVQTLGRTILQAYHGLWSVRGARNGIAPLLFVDAGNPFVKPLKACTWRVDADRREIRLKWRSIDADALMAKVQAARHQAAPPFGIRRFGNGGAFWISVPSFALGSEEVRQDMDALRGVLEREGEVIRASQIIVIDVRGNGGGSSSVGDELIEALWGPAVLDEARPRGIYVDWRVSAGNVRFLRRVNLARLSERYGADDPDVRSYRDFVDSMEDALDQGKVFHRDEDVDEDSSGGLRHRVEARVFFLTDHACFSACLDFADRMRSIPGVVHIGLETRADAVYIDNRAERLPSGMGLVGFSMKVYRNRPRGHNESYVPERAWDGDIKDDMALERWILGLAKDEGRGDGKRGSWKKGVRLTFSAFY